MNKHYVYALTDDDGDIFYIGRTSSTLERRLAQHINSATKPIAEMTRNQMYMKFLLSGGECIHISKLDEFDEKWKSEFMEETYIQYWGGELTNTIGRSYVKKPYYQCLLTRLRIDLYHGDNNMVGDEFPF